MLREDLAFIKVIKFTLEIDSLLWCHLSFQIRESALTVIRSYIDTADVGRVVIEGDVPLSAFRSAVVHHDVVLGPADQVRTL